MAYIYWGDFGGEARLPDAGAWHVGVRQSAPLEEFCRMGNRTMERLRREQLSARQDERDAVIVIHRPTLWPLSIGGRQAVIADRRDFAIMLRAQQVKVPKRIRRVDNIDVRGS
jgi:hypothetical protein